jgi:hypothetical protein
MLRRAQHERSSYFLLSYLVHPELVEAYLELSRRGCRLHGILV